MRNYYKVLRDPDTHVKQIRDQGFVDFTDDAGTIFYNVQDRGSDEFYDFMVGEYPDYEATFNFARSSPLDQEEPNFIHSDEMMGDLTAVLYLNKVRPEGSGTTLYSKSKLGGYPIPYRDNNGIYNSVFVFDSNILHSRNIFENFGDGDNSRLVQVMFLNQKK